MALIRKMRRDLRRVIDAQNIPPKDRTVLIAHVLRAIARKFGAQQANWVIRDFGLADQG
jgi:hypothetical protein